MRVDIEIPDDIASKIQTNWSDLPRLVLESFVIEAYRTELITSSEVGRILKLSSRFEVDEFLKQAEAYLHYTETDLEEDRQTLHSLRAK